MDGRAVRVWTRVLFGVAFLACVVEAAAFGFLVNAGDAGWLVLDAGVPDFEPVSWDWLTIATCRAVGLFFPGLATTVVGLAASVFGLRLVGAGDDLRGRGCAGAALDAWVDLARKGLAGLEGVGSVGVEGAVDW